MAKKTMTERSLYRPGFRMRVLGSVLALLALATAGGLVLQRAVLLRGLDQDVAASLEQEREELEDLAAGRNPLTGERFGGDVRAIFDTFLQRNVPQEGEVYITFVGGEPYRTTPAPLRLDADPELAARWGGLTVGERGRLTTDAGPVEYLAVPLIGDDAVGGVFVVANFIQGEREQIQSAIRVEAVVSLVVLLLVTLIAWALAGRLLRPVKELTEAAQTISDTDLTRRIPVEGNDEISRLGRTFNEMLDRLEEAFALQRRFIDDAGHELRTPLTIVRGHLDVLGDDPDERNEAMTLISDELDRMARIVEDLLLLAKSQHPDFLNLQRVELADLTTEVLVKSRALGARNWTLDACAEGIIDGDPQRLTQALLNLARNAVEHTAPGSEIGVGSAWVGTAVHMWVRDTGYGIDPDEQERIFERFARGRTGRRSEGAGLGLSIVRTIADAHGGTVELDSTPGAGSRFTIVIPASPPDHLPMGGRFPQEDGVELPERTF